MGRYLARRTLGSNSRARHRCGSGIDLIDQPVKLCEFGTYDWGMLARGCGFCHRGVAVWRDGNELRVFINTRWRLIALDGRTGEPITSFGHQGEVDLTAN